MLGFDVAGLAMYSMAARRIRWSSRAALRRLLQLTQRRPRTQAGHPILPGSGSDRGQRPGGLRCVGLGPPADRALPVVGVIAAPRSLQRRDRVGGVASARVGWSDRWSSFGLPFELSCHSRVVLGSGGPQIARPSNGGKGVRPLRREQSRVKWPVRESSLPLHRVPVVPDPPAGLDDDEIEPQRQSRDRRPIRQRPAVDQSVRRRTDPRRACDGRRSPRASRSHGRPASAPRRRRARPEDPGRSPRGRARGDRHGRSGPGRSNRLPPAASRPASRRHHPPAGPRSASGRRVGPPSRHRRRRPLSATYQASGRRRQLQ